MNKAVFAVLLGLLMANFSLAEEDRRAKAMERVQQNLQEASERLALTDQQLEAVRPVLQDDAEQRLQVMQQYMLDDKGERKKPSRKEMRDIRAQIQLINERTYESLGNILDDEQLEEYRKMQDERRQRMREQARDRD